MTAAASVVVTLATLAIMLTITLAACDAVGRARRRRRDVEPSPETRAEANLQTFLSEVWQSGDVGFMSLDEDGNVVSKSFSPRKGREDA